MGKRGGGQTEKKKGAAQSLTVRGERKKKKKGWEGDQRKSDGPRLKGGLLKKRVTSCGGSDWGWGEKVRWKTQISHCRGRTLGGYHIA